jgi:hypothetical protein
MNRFLVIFIALYLTCVNSVGMAQYQKVIDTNYPWYTDIIKYLEPTGEGKNVITASSYEIVPIDETVDFSKQLVFLNDDRLRFIFPAALNKMRKEYGKKELKHDHKICERIANSYENNLPETEYNSYALYIPAYYANIINKFEDKERAFCDYMIDLATVMDVNFYKLTNAKATKFGFYLKRDQDNNYSFLLVVK